MVKGQFYQKKGTLGTLSLLLELQKVSFDSIEVKGPFYKLEAQLDQCLESCTISDQEIGSKTLSYLLIKMKNKPEIRFVY